MGVENTLLTRNQSITNYTKENVFLRDNQFIQGDFTNAEVTAVELTIGTLMGRISATGELAVLKSASTDGSQFPIGILAETLTVDPSDSVGITVCVSGQVAKDLVILDGTDELTTVISGRQIQDRIAADTVGVMLVQVDELSGFDNQ